MQAPLYTTRATATGGRTGTAHTEDGHLKLELVSPGVPNASATSTNPEQLFACGYAACYAGACAYAAKQLGIELAAAPVVESEVSLHKRDEGGFTVTASLHLKLEGVTQQQAEEIAAKGHTICPYSHILNKAAVTTTATGTPALA